MQRACGHDLDMSRGWGGIRWAAQKREVAPCRVQRLSRRRGNERAGLLRGSLAHDADNDVRYFVKACAS